MAARKKTSARKTKTKKKTARKTVRKKTTKKVAKKAGKKKATRKAVRKTAKKKATRKVARKVSKKKPTRKATKKKAAKKTARKATKKKRKAGSALMMPVQPDDALAAVVGGKPIPRSQVVKKLWMYIKKNDLQDATDRRMINADARLKVVFGGKRKVNMFEMTKLVSNHLH